jgi:hypothetical protein
VSVEIDAKTHRNFAGWRQTQWHANLVNLTYGYRTLASLRRKRVVIKLRARQFDAACNGRFWCETGAVREASECTVPPLRVRYNLKPSADGPRNHQRH